MANRLKKEQAAKSSKSIPKPPKAVTGFKKEKEEKIDIVEVARDERTRKIVGTIFLLCSVFFLIAYISYFFTWKDDQAQVQQGASVLFKKDVKVSNLLGRLGAYMSHLLIYKGFGIASILISTFFFVVGINLISRKKVFSIWRNLKYVTLGLLVLSVSLAFVFYGNPFPYGGKVGIMISDWLIGALGNIGTAAVLLIIGIAYIIWQFNPRLDFSTTPKLSEQDLETQAINPITDIEAQNSVAETINDLYGKKAKANILKGDSKMIAPSANDEDQPSSIQVIEKEEPIEENLGANNQAGVEVDTELMGHNPFAKNEKNKELPLEVSNEYDEQIEEDITLPTPATKLNQVKAPALELEITNVGEMQENLPEIEPVKKVISSDPYDPQLELRNYKFPTLDLLETYGGEKIVQDPAELENNKNQIISTLRNYSIEIQKISATIGPTVTLYEIVPAAGVRISRIKNLEDDIALSLAALGIRIIAPIPGRGTIGIEVPNTKKTIVGMKGLLASEKFQNNHFALPIALGKKIDNENFIVDLASMPHLLMAGATGQGKSVGVNALLVSLLYKKHPSQLKFVLIDPKKVELSVYSVIANHFLARLPNEEEAIITDTKKVIYTLNALCIEMDNRYDLLKEAGCRNIKEYNAKFVSRRLNPEKGHQFLPFIVLVIDEFADLIMTAGKEIEMPIARLAQLARAVGIHLIIATQRPSVNIITGTIKANFPARIAFKVSSKIDSRTILDIGGAEQLIGKGDMLISYNGELVRLQCAFVDTPEIDRICDFIGYQEGHPEPFLLPEYVDEKDQESKEFDLGDKDSMFEDAARLIVQNQIGSTSLLQRRMKLGYNRAGRLMDQLEAAGIVGPNQGSKARDVLIKTEAELMQHLSLLD